MSDVMDWLKSLPIFTRYWFSCTVVLSLIGRFQLINPMSLTLVLDPILRNFEIWRLVTSVFYCPISPATGFHFLFMLLMLYKYSLKLERGEYNGRPADYCFMLLFNWVCCIIIGLICDFPVLMDVMVLSVLYIWCQLNSTSTFTLGFGAQFQAMYLPWLFFAINLIVSGTAVLELAGILVGHLYVLLKFKYPQELGGPELLKTPAILESYFPPQTGGTWFGTAPTQRSQQQQQQQQPNNRNMFGGHNWGTGHVLGR